MTYKKLLAAANAAVVTVILGLVANVSAADKYEVIHSFGGVSAGAGPTGLISDAAGNLYGTALYEGDATMGGNGVVFKLSHDATGRWSETVLHTFQGKDGANPAAGLIFDKARNLYGTTQNGGTYGNGTVFKLIPEPDGEWSETVLHSFRSADGSNPAAGLIFDQAGNLYGTTAGGGGHNSGLVFKLASATNGEWIETVLYDFQGTDGANPSARLSLDRAGNLYGTTFSRGGGFLGLGVVFKLSPEPKGEWSETVLHSFQGPPDDGYQPSGALIIDAAGYLYGTTANGGSSGNCLYAGCGTLFQITP